MKHLLVVLLISTHVFAQDTLNCNRDLTWEKNEKYYFKKEDTYNKQRYDGPVKERPTSNQLNIGYLKNGVWEGTVYNYVNNKKAGFSNYTNGFLDGLTLRTIENDGVTFIIDSLIYHYNPELIESKPLYTKHLERIKNSYYVKWITEKIWIGDTLIIKSQDGEDFYPISVTVEKYVKNIKNGWSENYIIKEDKNGVKSQENDSQVFYKNDEIIIMRDYFQNELNEERYYELKKLVRKVEYTAGQKTETTYKNGTTVLEVKVFDKEGKLMYTDKYKNGKLIAD
jgi:antitoxin component YwqK of YwqJK toxin-antitoxin module